MSLAGHLWTVMQYSRLARRRSELPPARNWATELNDPSVGRIGLTGRLRPEGDDILVVVHGLGGCVDSGYVSVAESAAAACGVASLALNVRGADRRGADFPHAALTDDLAAAIGSPELSRYGRILLLGYSLGGHVVLRHATEPLDERVAAVAAVCAPLDLARCCAYLDRPSGVLYRRHLLARLMEIYEAVAARQSVPIPVAEARRIRLQREFDDRIVAPRHGFQGVDDYHRRASVGPLLESLRVPALVVMAAADPIVPAASVEPFLDPPPPAVSVRWVKGGHVGFPADLDLGQVAPLGLESQALSWLCAANGNFRAKS